MRTFIKETLLFMLAIILFTSCNNQKANDQGWVKQKEAKIHSYVVHDDATNSFLYYYVILSTLNGHSNYYYYSSPTPVTNFSNVNFDAGEKLPFETAQAQDLGATEVATNQLSQEMQEDVEAFTEVQEVNEPVADPGSNDGADAEGNNISTGGSGAESESGSSESGSSDSGSGDSGGGDGGGGGGE